jgi:predicted RNA-binding Zn ribbon-like protein
MSDARKGLRDAKFVGGALCLDFVNTGGVLADYGDLLAWADLTGAIDTRQTGRLRRSSEADPIRAEAAFRRAVRLRDAIRRIFASQASGDPPAEKDLIHLSLAVAKSAKHLRLDPSAEGFAWRWYEAENRLDWPTWIVARSAAELLTSDRRDRVRVCDGPDCGWLFLDTSRNRSRRWCDMADCGNRAKARRSYARRRRGLAGTDSGRA